MSDFVIGGLEEEDEHHGPHAVKTSHC